MKLNKGDNQTLSDAIDKIHDGLNDVIEMYNQSEEDVPFVKFDSDVVEQINKAKGIFGDEYVDNKINNLVKEVISFIPFDDYEHHDEVDEIDDQQDINPEEDESEEKNRD